MTISVAAILVSVGVPSFQALLTSERLTTQANSMVSALNLARNKAVITHYRVGVARIGSDWNGGFQVFLDNNGDSTVSSGEVLQRYDAMPTGFTIKTAVGANILFGTDGRVSGVGSSFYFCSPSAQAKAKRVVIAATGRIRTEASSTYAGNCT